MTKMFSSVQLELAAYVSKVTFTSTFVYLCTLRKHLYRVSIHSTGEQECFSMLVSFLFFVFLNRGQLV